MIRTFVDTGVLILFARVDVRDQLRVMPFMYDPQRRFVVSPFVELELLPTPMRTGRADQLKFYREFLTKAEWIVDLKKIVEETFEVLLETSMPLADALHVGAASAADCDELLTAERPGRAMFANRRVKVVSIG